MRQRARFIYVVKPVGLQGPFKIGCSYEPRSRLEALLHWSPTPLELVVSFPGTMMLEANIHDCLAASHSHKEWFFPTDKVRAFVAALLAGIPVEEALNLQRREGCVRSKGRAKTPPSRCALTKWSMRLHWARKRAPRHCYLPLEVEIELERLRRARGEVPAEFNSAPIERFIADPISHSGAKPVSEVWRMVLPQPADVPRPALALEPTA